MLLSILHLYGIERASFGSSTAPLALTRIADAITPLLVVVACALALPAAAQLAEGPPGPKSTGPTVRYGRSSARTARRATVSTTTPFMRWIKPGWQTLIDSKHKPGEAALSDQDRNMLLDWLASKFGPDTKPFPRTYVPPEITTFFSDPEAKRLLNRACTTVTGWSAWKGPGMPKKPGASCWSTCESGALSSPTRNWNVWSNGWAGSGVPTRTNDPDTPYRPDACRPERTAAGANSRSPPHRQHRKRQRTGHHPDRCAALVHRCRARPVVAAWNLTVPPASNGRGGRAGGRGRAAIDPAPDPAAVDAAPAAGRVPLAAERGAAVVVEDAPQRRSSSSHTGRFLEGRLGSRADRGATCGRPKSPDMRFAYADKVAGPDGVERILLITDRRLGG